MSTKSTIDLKLNKSDKYLRNEESRKRCIVLWFVLCGKAVKDRHHYHCFNSYLLLFFYWNHFLSEMVHKSRFSPNLSLNHWIYSHISPNGQRFHYPLSVVTFHMVFKLIIASILRFLYKSITGKSVFLIFWSEYIIYWIIFRNSPNISVVERECTQTAGHWNRQRSGHRVFELEFRIHNHFVVYND